MSCICPDHHGKDKDGYLRTKYQSKEWRLHRLVWTLVYGEIPPGLVVAHRCNNKGCVNPEHLYLTTPELNSSDAARDGLYRKGEQNPNARWTDEEVLKMYSLYYENDWTQWQIADAYGISQSRVSECIARARRIDR